MWTTFKIIIKLKCKLKRQGNDADQRKCKILQNGFSFVGQLTYESRYRHAAMHDIILFCFLSGGFIFNLFFAYSEILPLPDFEDS